jgi:NTE family protein
LTVMSILRLPWVKRPGPHTVFVLGGGGNLGAIQVGMLRAVLERGIVPDEIVGCSVGAINAAAIAADPTPDGAQRLVDIWLGIKDDVICPAGKLSSIRLLTHRGSSLQPNDGLRRLLEHHLPHRTFEEFATPFHVVAASLRDGTERWFSKGDVIGPVLASAALPAIFPPVKIGDDLLTDGAIVNNVPISKALDLGATRVVVFHVGNFERRRPLPRRPIDVLVQSFSIARNARFSREAEIEHDGVEMIVLPGVDPGPLRFDDFRQSQRLIEQGHAAAATYLDTSAQEAVGV